MLKSGWVLNVNVVHHRLQDSALNALEMELLLKDGPGNQFISSTRAGCHP